MRKIILAALAGGLCSCATANNPADQVGNGAVNTATSATSGAINSQVGNATTSFWQRLFGGH